MGMWKIIRRDADGKRVIEEKDTEAEALDTVKGILGTPRFDEIIRIEGPAGRVYTRDQMAQECARKEKAREAVTTHHPPFDKPFQPKPVYKPKS